MGAQRISVVMITRDRWDAAVHAVGMLRALPERPPVIVVDNGSADPAPDELAGADGVRVLAAGRNLGCAGRTLGVRAADTPYVAFSDDDSWWAPGALAKAVELFDRHPRLGLVAGRTLVGPLERDDPLNAVLAAAPLGSAADLPGPRVLGFLACAAVVRRDAYLAAGGFHARLGVGGEEGLLAIDLAAAGWGLSYVPDVIAHHHPRRGPARVGRPTRQRRNDLWTTWLRHPAPVVVSRTAGCLWAALDDPTSRAAMRQAVAGLPWVAAERRRPSREVRQMLSRLARTQERRTMVGKVEPPAYARTDPQAGPR